jgi:hypothetical protein
MVFGFEQSANRLRQLFRIFERFTPVVGANPSVIVTSLKVMAAQKQGLAGGARRLELTGSGERRHGDLVVSGARKGRFFVT